MNASAPITSRPQRKPQLLVQRTILGGVKRRHQDCGENERATVAAEIMDPEATAS